jgi:hypothetical protein
MQRFHREAAASALGVLGCFATGGSMSVAPRGYWPTSERWAYCRGVVVSRFVSGFH